MTDNVTDFDNMTRSEHGTVVFRTLTEMFDFMLSNAPSLVESLRLKAEYAIAVKHLNSACGSNYKVTLDVNKETANAKAVSLVGSVQKAQQFLTGHLGTTNFNMLIMSPNIKLRNLVDYQPYTHLASVTFEKTPGVTPTHYLCVSTTGTWVLSDASYWESLS